MDRPRLDKATIDETAWTEAVAQEAVIRPLASAERLTPSEIAFRTSLVSSQKHRATIPLILDIHQKQPSGISARADFVTGL